MFSGKLIMDLFHYSQEHGFLLLPSWAGAEEDLAACLNSSRILKCTFNWTEADVKALLPEWKSFVASLFEIGEWYANSEEEYGSRPDPDYMDDENSMAIWEKYIRIYPEAVQADDTTAFCKEHKIEGYTPDLFLEMVNRYCKLIALDAPLCVFAHEEVSLAYSYIVNKFATKVERIDTFVDDQEYASYFKDFGEVTDQDLEAIRDYLKELGEYQGLTKKAAHFLFMCDFYSEGEALDPQLLRKIYEKIEGDFQKTEKENLAYFSSISGMEEETVKAIYGIAEESDYPAGFARATNMPAGSAREYVNYIFRMMKM